MNKLEVCCGSVKDCIIAQQNNADRIELNSALYLGGLTPTIATFKMAKAHVSIPIITMVRPRGAGFLYSTLEREVMFQEAKEFLEAGADGIAFGFLETNRTIGKDDTNKMVTLIHSYQKEAVFHRAFDCVRDPFEAIETLIELKIDRVLTSGLKKNAIEGIPLLKTLQKKYGKQIEILAGCGVHEHNVLDILGQTTITQVHSSCKGWFNDPTTSTTDVTYGYAPAPHTNDYDEVLDIKVQELVRKVHKVGDD